MDCIALREREFADDLESGKTTNEEVEIPDSISGTKFAKTIFTKVCSGFVGVEGLNKGENGLNFDIDLKNGSEVSPEKLEVVMDKKVEGVDAANQTEKKSGKEKRNSTSAKKPPKPPRPPRGLSIDAANQKLTKQIAELAMIKRARIERMKALKKTKTVKASSSNGNLVAMLFTILFCLVIIFQGMYSRSSSPVSFRGPPELARAEDSGFALVHDRWNLSAIDPRILGSGSPNSAEQVSGSDTESKVSRAVG